MKNLIAPAAIAALLAVAACSDAPESPAPETNQAVEEPAAPPAPAPEPIPAPAPAPTTPPASDAEALSNSMMQALPPETRTALEQQIREMTPAEREEAVAEARRTAEDMARQQGLPDELVTQVGDQAEAAARQTFGAN